MERLLQNRNVANKKIFMPSNLSTKQINNIQTETEYQQTNVFLSISRSVHAELVNNAKYLQEDMLNKLLRPPVKKQSKGQLRKYDPLFPKPDVQKLIHENNLLKTQITENSKIIMELRFKVKEQQRKIQKFEQKYSQNLQQILQRKKKNPSIHTQILKKKIHQLHTKFINSQSQIKRLKKLPSASIYQENNIEKQHLLAQTIRLKSILTSFSGQPVQFQNQISEAKQICANNGGDVLSSINNTKFQQQFLRMLKEQNQKLKATIRLLQNDKILMKARQTTQNKQNNDLKKQYQSIKNRLISKQAQIQKLIHENQNLLFKKAAKFRLQKQQKQNKLISQLTQTIQNQRIKLKKMQQQKEQLMNDNKNIKQKQQKKNTELLQKDKQLQKIKVQLSEIKNQYEARIKSLQMNKLHSKQSIFARSSKGKSSQIFRKSLFGSQNNQQQNYGEQYQNYQFKNQQNFQNEKRIQNFNWGKPVKFQQLDICLLKLWAIKEEKIISKYQDLINLLPGSQNESERNQPNNCYSSNYLMTFEQLYYLLKSHPINFTSKQSLKMSKYIFSDHSQMSKNSLRKTYGKQRKQQPIIQASLALTIIKASINQFTQCLSNSNVINSWKCFTSKTKKFVKQLQDLNSDTISKDVFVEILIKNKTSTIHFEQINFMLLYGFNYVRSVEQVILDKKKILQCIYALMGDMKYITSIFQKSSLNFDQLTPENNLKSIHNLRKTSIMNNSLNKNPKSIFNKNIETEQKKSINTKSQYTKKPGTSKSILKNMQKCKTLYPRCIKQQKKDMQQSNEYPQLRIKKIITQEDEDIPKKKNKKHKNRYNQAQFARNHGIFQELEASEYKENKKLEQNMNQIQILDDSQGYLQVNKIRKQSESFISSQSAQQNQNQQPQVLESDVFQPELPSILTDNQNQNNQQEEQQEQQEEASNINNDQTFNQEEQQQNQTQSNNSNKQTYQLDKNKQYNSTNQLLSQLFGLKLNNHRSRTHFPAN